jgi:hypothetical protein
MRGSSQRRDWNGAIAQLGERLDGIQEVVGSIPTGSTNSLIDTAILDGAFGFPGLKQKVIKTYKPVTPMD